MTIWYIYIYLLLNRNTARTRSSTPVRPKKRSMAETFRIKLINKSVDAQSAIADVMFIITFRGTLMPINTKSERIARFPHMRVRIYEWEVSVACAVGGGVVL